MPRGNIRLLTLGLLAVLAGCGSSGGGKAGNGDSGSGGGSSAPWSDTAMQTLVAGRCAKSGCHNGSQSPSYKSISEAAMKSDRRALTEVRSGRMPRDGALSDSETTTFLNFYQQ